MADKVNWAQKIRQVRGKLQGDSAETRESPMEYAQRLLSRQREGGP